MLLTWLRCFLLGRNLNFMTDGRDEAMIGPALVGPRNSSGVQHILLIA